VSVGIPTIKRQPVYFNSWNFCIYIFVQCRENWRTGILHRR